MFSTDRMCQFYTDYIFANKADSRHVRRIIPWLGFIVKGIAKVADDWNPLHERQGEFRIGGEYYKVRYSHLIQTGIQRTGGIEIVQRIGNRDGNVMVTMRSLDDAEHFYMKPRIFAAMPVSA